MVKTSHTCTSSNLYVVIESHFTSTIYVTIFAAECLKIKILIDIHVWTVLQSV